MSERLTVSGVRNNPDHCLLDFLSAFRDASSFLCPKMRVMLRVWARASPQGLAVWLWVFRAYRGEHLLISYHVPELFWALYNT